MAEAEAPKYQKFTQDQIDLWLSQPLTKTYLQALIWRREDCQDALGTGQILDSSNADLSHAMSHSMLGKQDAYADAARPQDVLEHYELVFIPETEEEEEEDAGEQSEPE